MNRNSYHRPRESMCGVWYYGTIVGLIGLSDSAGLSGPSGVFGIANRRWTRRANCS